MIWLALSVVPVLAITEEAVLALLQSTQEVLTNGHATIRDDSLGSKIESYQREINGLKVLQQQLDHQEKEIDRLVALVNAKQVEGFLVRLNDTLVKETNLRQAQAHSQKVSKPKEIKVDYIDRNDLPAKFNARKAISDADIEISQWILRFAQDELQHYKQDVLTAYKEGTQKESEACPAVIDVVQEVQGALTKFSQDGIGIIDHAQGGEIVHSMTSPTYSPPPDESQFLGNVWWRTLIPEDWEQLLPRGWEWWNVGLPSYLYHTLNLRRGPHTAPPETILERKVQPLSCWPMDGTRGQVTIRLPYPIKVESFTLDHISWSIVPEGAHKSAPKKLKVIAYPVCQDQDECGALGFDGSDPMEVAQMEYDVDGPTIQTFDSVFVQEKAKSREVRSNELDADEPYDDDDDDDEDETSCSASCSTPPEISVAAITVKILENHGNPDYTCLYRFRVHGEQILS